jgi:hypothetical protein
MRDRPKPPPDPRTKLLADLAVESVLGPSAFARARRLSYLGIWQSNWDSKTIGEEDHMQLLSQVSERTNGGVTTRTYEVGNVPAIVTAVIAGIAAAGSFGSFLINLGVLHKF